MGSCGCGDFDGVRWAVTVGKYVLAVSEYDGCNNGCSAPLGFTLHLMTKKNAKEWGVEPTGAWVPDEYGSSEQFLNFFSQDQLAQAVREMTADPPDPADYDSLADMLDEDALDLMRAAWKLTVAKEEELAKRFGVKPPFGSGAAKGQG